MADQEIAQLGIEIDSSGVDEARLSLDNLAEAATRAEASATSLARSQTQAMQAGVRQQQAQENFSKSAAAAAAATEKQQQELSKLLGQIDPVVAALERLDQQEEKLRGFRATGALDAETFGAFKATIDRNRDALGVFDDSLTRTGNTSKQTAQAIRQLPAQFSDIFISLQAGQSPLQVFLQQGAQIKDSFGGVGAALRETGRFALGLVNPFTVAAVAVGGLALAWKQGVDESQEFAKAIATTGNAAGVTVGELNELAAAIDGVTGTQAKAAEALTLVVQSAAFTKDQLQVVAQAAVELEAATGRALESTIDDFRKLAKDPVDASLKLAETSNFLTAQLFEQIDALQRQGREGEAAALAINAYAEATRETAQEVKSQLNPVIQAFKNLFNAAKEAWDEATGVGRGDALSRQLEDVRKRIRETLAGGARGEGISVDQDRLKQLRAEEQALIDQQNLERAIAAEEAENRRRARAGQEALRSLRDDLDDAASPAEKLGEALADIEKRAKKAADAGTPISDQEIKRLQDAARARFDTDSQAKASEFDRLRVQNLDKQAQLEEKIARIRSVGAKEGRSQAEIEKVVADARAKFAESQARASGAGSAVRDDAATRLLLNLREQESALSLQLNTSEKLTAAEKERAKFIQQIADLQNKEVLTAEQKSLLANQDAIKAQLDKNVALESEIRLRDESLKLQERSEQLSQTIAAANESRVAQNRDILGTFGLGRQEREVVESFGRIRKEFARYRQELDEATPEDLLGSDQYQDAVREIERGLADALEAQRQYYDELKALQADAAKGAKESLADYVTSAQDIAGQTADLTNNILGGVEDSFVELATTGKTSFRDLADSILADIARIGVRSLISNAIIGAGFGPAGAQQQGIDFGGLFSSAAGFLGGLFGGGAGGAATYTGAFGFEGGGFTGYGQRAGGLDGRGGFLAMVHPNETVIDHTKPGSSSIGGSSSNSIVINGLSLPNVTNAREGKRAAATIAREVNSLIVGSARFA